MVLSCGKTSRASKKIIPIARDAGGYLICLNFNIPSISVEIFNQHSNKTYFIANNFDDFVNLWTE
ncbi:SMI1/KNR4 family protein [Pseudomonas fluorescens]|uniref:SMI1/KNR4 family protein n=1 Tax=Pseudomonas fluorescens TaxID=294 RepID=UPI0039900163